MRDPVAPDAESPACAAGLLLLDRDIGEVDEEGVGVVVLIEVVAGAGSGIGAADAAGRRNRQAHFAWVIEGSMNWLVASRSGVRSAAGATLPAAKIGFVTSRTCATLAMSKLPSPGPVPTMP